MKIEFLGMKDGCPNTPKMWVSLQKALSELNWEVEIDPLDLNDLSQARDPRAGYGSPTILVSGIDLFGTLPHTSLNPACRFYPDGVFNEEIIGKKLRAIRGLRHIE